MTSGKIDLSLAAVRRIVFLWVLLSAVTGLYPVCPAIAGPMDTFGAGARNIAMGGTGVASSDSYEASYYNPAALGLVPNLEVGVGFSVYRPWLTARYNSFDSATSTISPSTSQRFDRAQVFVEAGLATPIPLGKGLSRHLFFGLFVQSPADSVYSISSMESAEPVFPLYEERNCRLSLNAAVSGRYKWFMVGVGLSVLPTVKGTVRMDLADSSLQNYLGIDVGLAVLANAGLLFEPISGLTIGLSYRGAGKTDITLPVDAAVTSVPVYLTVSAATYFTPHQISFGVGWKQKNYRVSADVVFAMFSRFNVGSPTLTVYSSSARDDVTSLGETYNAGMRDTVTVRTGGEYRPIMPVALRAGVSWAQSPISIQSGDTNLLGGDQFSGSFGIGFDAIHVGGPDISVDAYFMAAAVIDNTDTKVTSDATNPGYPTIGGGGWFLNSGLSIRFGF